MREIGEDVEMLRKLWGDNNSPTGLFLIVSGVLPPLMTCFMETLTLFANISFKVLSLS